MIGPSLGRFQGVRVWGVKVLGSRFGRRPALMVNLTRVVTRYDQKTQAVKRYHWKTSPPPRGG